jgi:hypothetical protein
VSLLVRGGQSSVTGPAFALDNAPIGRVSSNRLRKWGVCSEKSDSAIMVMKSAEDRHRCDATPVLDGARAMDRSIFAKRPMSP